ncbi:MAG TPA: hypothetical protein VHT75_13765, partial [Acidimicrobiales bacterium]|nr:hypothetical protein [Acidimicrobiales bacterium]
GAAGNQPVVVHWMSATGPVLATALPNATGDFSTTVKVPEAPPGSYLFVATQGNGKGADVYGTPSRTAFTVLASTPPTVATPAASVAPLVSHVAVRRPTGHGVATTAGIGIVGLAVVGIGAAAVFRATRRAPRR